MTGDIDDQGGVLEVQLFDFFYVTGDFGFTTVNDDLVRNDGNTFNNVDYKLLTGIGVNAFVGNGPATDPARFGLELSNINFSLPLFTDATDVSYTALKSSDGTASFIGLPNLVLEAWLFNVELNQTSDLLNPNRVLDFDASGAVVGIPVTPAGGPTIDFEGADGNLLHVAGDAVVDAFGSVVAKGGFDLVLGEVSGNDNAGTDPDVSFTNADAVSLTLTDAELFAGVGGSLLDNNGGTATPDDYSDDTVMDGTLGLGGMLTGDLRLVAINAGGASYLGMESDADALSADLIGLDALLEFHAYAGTLKLNKKGGTATEKLDWDSLSTTGLTLAALIVDEAMICRWRAEWRSMCSLGFWWRRVTSRCRWARWKTARV